MIPRPPRWTSPDIDEVIAAQGGLFWLEGEHQESTVDLLHTLTGRFDRYVEFAEASLYRDRPRRISYGFLCSSDFNAFAYSTPPPVTPPLDFIGINIGVVFTLLDTFARILAQPDTFPDVGNRSLENPSGAGLRPLTTNVMSLPPSGVGPVCSVRSLFAGVLAQTALDYLFFHQLTHLRNGHCDYTREHLAGSWLAEIAAVVQEASDLLIQQTLEMDADSGAVLHALNEAFKLKDMLQGTTQVLEPDTLAVIEAAYGTAERATRTVAYGAYVLFRLFDDSGWDHGVQSSRSHPQPAIRMSWIGPTVYEILLQRPAYGYDALAFAKDMAEIIGDAEVACGSIQGLPADPHAIASVYQTASSLDYLNSLGSTWSSIRPELEKLKRGGKLPD